MTLSKLIAVVRRNVNDPDGSIFKQPDIEYYINEAIYRFQAYVYFADEQSLDTQISEPVYIPSQYHHLLAVYSSARLFAQDERHYQASTFMNEFEVKFEELITKIESGEITILDSLGSEVTADYEDDFVTNVYFSSSEITDLEVIPD